MLLCLPLHNSGAVPPVHEFTNGPRILQIIFWQIERVPGIVKRSVTVDDSLFRCYEYIGHSLLFEAFDINDVSKVGSALVFKRLSL